MVLIESAENLEINEYLQKCLIYSCVLPHWNSEPYVNSACKEVYHYSQFSQGDSVKPCRQRENAESSFVDQTKTD